jgi:small ligand-binding sensory domain FIST
MPESNRAHSRIVLSTFDDDLVVKVVEECREAVGGKASCVFAFVSSDWRPHLADFLEIVQIHGRAPLVIGCSADGLIGVGEEDENVSGFSLLFLNLPNTDVRCTEVSQSEVEEAGGSGYWSDVTGITPEDVSGWILLSNPLDIDTEAWLKSWNSSYGETPCFGGLASGGREQEELFLMRNGDVSEVGGLAISFSGGVRIGGIVSQGCRPIGDPYTITEVDDNVLLGIASRGAYQVLEETFDKLADEEKERAQRNILAGLAMDENVDEHTRGSFLVRSILGGDPEAGALALGAFPRVGQTLQFQMRDKDSADEELRRLCVDYQRDRGEPFAGLVFTCSGRGARMFGVPNHDAGVIEDTFGKVPVAGYFCNGEIGPVGGTNFVHGFTASVALFMNA